MCARFNLSNIRILSLLSKCQLTEQLHHDHNHDFQLIFGRNVSVADGEDSRAAKIERIEVFCEIGLGVGPNCSDPVGLGVIERAYEEQNGLDRAKGTSRCAMMKRLIMRSKILNWYS